METCLFETDAIRRVDGVMVSCVDNEIVEPGSNSNLDSLYSLCSNSICNGMNPLFS